MTNLLALPSGTVLAGDFRIERVLGAGGFGITYLAEETPLARLVTIKEYFPADYAARDGAIDASPRSQDCAGDYRWGLDRFLEEAQTLAKFDHPNIVRVYRYFRANNTGYMVLHFEEGASFKGWLKSLGRAPRQHEFDRIVAPLLDALELIHEADFLHRDIAPDNIIIRKDGSPVLIDFGSARGDIAQHSMTVSALVKPGYSAYEQYATTSRQQGPWSDIYSLGATLYQAATGKRPPDAPSRMVDDELIPARDAALSSYRSGFLAAIDKALALEITARPKSVGVWRTELLDSAVPAAAPAPKAAPALPRPSASKSPGQRRKPQPSVADRGRAVFNRQLKRGQAAAKAARAWKNRLAKPGLLANAAALLKMKRRAKAPEPQARKPWQLLSRPAKSRSRWRWRPLAVKLLIGLGVASTAVAMQDRFPAVQRRGASTMLSQAAEAGPIAQLKGHAGAISGAAFADDGKWIVSAAADGTIKVWNTASFTLVRTLELDSGPATALAVRDRRAVSGHKDGSIALWDLASGDRLATFKRNEARIWAVTFLGDQDRVAAAGHDWALALFDSRLPSAPAHVLEGHENAVQAVAYSAEGPLLSSGSADRTVRLWNPVTFDLIRTYRGHNDFVTAVALSPNGRMLASASLDGAIRFWSTSSHRTYRVVRRHRGRVTALAFSPAGRLMASAGEDGAIVLWDAQRRRPMRTLHSPGGEIHAVSFAPDGRRLLSGSSDGIVRVWDAGTTRPAS